MIGLIIKINDLIDDLVEIRNEHGNILVRAEDDYGFYQIKKIHLENTRMGPVCKIQRMHYRWEKRCECDIWPKEDKE